MVQSADSDADDLYLRAAVLVTRFFCVFFYAQRYALVITFEGLSRLKQKCSFGKLIIGTCVCCAVLCAVIHLGVIENREAGSPAARRGEGKERESAQLKQT